MKFLVDAQLPGRLASFLVKAGHDVVHTTQLPAGIGRLMARSPNWLIVTVGSS